MPAPKSSAPKSVERPLSPHLSIYRFEMTMASSIFVRITGNALIAPVAIFIVWLLAAAVHAPSFDFINWLLTTWFGELVLLACAWAYWFQFLGGLRHLIYDSGYLQDIRSGMLFGWVMFIGATVLTVLTGLLMLLVG